MVGRVDHVGIVVADLGEALALYRGLLGFPATDVMENRREAITMVFLRAGDSMIELIQPTSDDTGVARFLERRGPGMHHVCYEVDDILAEIGRLRDAGLKVLDDVPRRGLHGEKLAFVHPKSMLGVLVELYQAGSRERDLWIGGGA